MMVYSQVLVDNKETQQQEPATAPLTQTETTPTKSYPITRDIIEKILDKLGKLWAIMDVEYNDEKQVDEINELVSYLVHAQIQIKTEQILRENERLKQK